MSERDDGGPTWSKEEGKCKTYAHREQGHETSDIYWDGEVVCHTKTRRQMRTMLTLVEVVGCLTSAERIAVIQRMGLTPVQLELLHWYQPETL